MRSRVRLQINTDSDQDKVCTENEREESQSCRVDTCSFGSEISAKEEATPVNHQTVKRRGGFENVGDSTFPFK